MEKKIVKYEILRRVISDGRAVYETLVYENEPILGKHSTFNTQFMNYPPDDSWVRKLPGRKIRVFTKRIGALVDVKLDGNLLKDVVVFRMVKDSPDQFIGVCITSNEVYAVSWSQVVQPELHA